jgi:phospholipase C
MDKIEHVVLLMMENRSFDSLLGWLYERKAPAKNVPPLKTGQRPYDGLEGLNLKDYENVDATGTIRREPIKGAQGINVPNVAPGENFTQVTTQLFEWPFEMTSAAPIQMTPGGVLVAGKWRTHSAVKSMSAQQIRDALIDVMVENSKGEKEASKTYFRQFKDSRANDGPLDEDLPGKAAIVAFLRDATNRSADWLRERTDLEQRSALIDWLSENGSVSPSELKSMTNQELVLLGWTRWRQPTMKGYVRDYTNELRHLGYDEDHVKRYAGQVMQSYTPDQLPVLNGLAEHYAVCDRWFSSVPSQTNPNRAFALCGTSMGLVNNGFLEQDPRRIKVEEIAGYLIGDDRFEAKTVFNALEDVNATWKIFRQSGYLQDNIYKAIEAFKISTPAGASASAIAAWATAVGLVFTGPFAGPIALFEVLAAVGAIILRAIGDEAATYLQELSSAEVVSDYTHRLFPEIHKIANVDSHFAKLDEFHRLARAGQLPHLSYIEPEWTIGHVGTGASFGKFGLGAVLFHQGRDYHPPVNLDAAENLVREVYSSLIANRSAWEKTLLIITFDEPVGSFDHVPPPAATPPWGNQKPPVKREYNFDFKRYGGRVPAIVVSPLVEKGVVFRAPNDEVPFDHTSIIATVLKWRKLETKIGDFGERTKQAPTFENVVSLSAPRTDEREVRFFKSHKAGEPVRFYDRFYLKDFSGRYVAGFNEHFVFPGSIFSNDPTISQYFPTLESLQPGASRTAFYFQNANNRPDTGPIAASGRTEVRLVATDDGLGSYNVLGSWKDSRDVYYFNDYMKGEGAEDEQESWKIIKTDNSNLHFGDRVLIQNKFDFEWGMGGPEQCLIPCRDHSGYLTTKGSGWWSWTQGPYPAAEFFWTIEPIPAKEGALIKSPEKAEVYLVQDGQRHWIPNPATLASKWSRAQVQTVPMETLDAIPLGDPLPYLIRPSEKAEVYLVQGGQRHWIPDGATLDAKWSWAQVEIVSQETAEAIPLGDPVPKLIRAQEKAEVYLVLGGQRHWIPDRATLQSRWASEPVQVVPQETADAIPLGDPVAQEGSLVKSPANVNVYLVQGGQRHCVTDFATLQSRWSSAPVQTVHQETMDAVPLGEPVPTLMRSLATPDAYLVQGGQRHLIPDSATLQCMWSAAHMLTVPQETVDAISLGDPVPKEGSLIKSQAKPEVYLVQGGRRHWIPDPATLQSRWSPQPVLIAPQEMVDVVPLGEPVPKEWSLIESPTKPEVYLVQEGRRHRVLDLATVHRRWPWVPPVQTLRQETVDAIPSGDPVPNLIKSEAKPNDVYLLQGNQRHRIPDSATLQSRWNPAHVLTVPQETVDDISLGDPLPSVLKR